jgi:hypothetical protein
MWAKIGTVLCCSLSLSLLGTASTKFDDFHSNLGKFHFLETGGESIPSDPPSAPLSPGTESPSLTDQEIDELLFGDLWDDEMHLHDQDGQTPPLMTEPEIGWFHSLGIETGAGYADNPLYGNYQPQGSGFTALGAEAFSMLTGSPHHELLLYFYADGKKFFDLGSEDISGLILAQVDYSFSPYLSPLSYGVRAQNTFYDQGMDFSEIGLSYRMKVASNRSAFQPRIEWQIHENFKSVLELGIEKESYRNIADGSEAFGASFKFSGGFAKRWKWSGQLSAKKTNYQDRKPKDADGTAKIGKLDTVTMEPSFSLKYSDRLRVFQETALKLSSKHTMEDQGGYYQSNRLKVALAQAIKWELWLFELSGTYSNTRYPHRLTGGGQLLRRNGWTWDFSITQELSEHWQAYLRWNQERESSNDPTFAFRSNFWTLGASWEK